MDIYLVPAGRHHYGLYCEVEDRRPSPRTPRASGWRAALEPAVPPGPGVPRGRAPRPAREGHGRRAPDAPAAPARPRARLARRARGRAAPALVPAQRAGGHARTIPTTCRPTHAERWCAAIAAPRRPPPPGVDVRARAASTWRRCRSRRSRVRTSCRCYFSFRAHRAFPLVAGHAPRAPARRVAVRGVGPADRTAAPASADAGRPGGARARGRRAPEPAASRHLRRADGPRRPVIYSRRVTLRELAERLGCRLRRRRATSRSGASTTLEARRARRRVLPRQQEIRVAGGDDARLGGHRRRGRARRRRARCCAAQDPYLAFAAAVALLAPDDRPAPGVSPAAVVAPGAVLGPGVSHRRVRVRSAPAPSSARAPSCIRTRSSTPGASIGDDCVIHAHVSIRERCSHRPPRRHPERRRHRQRRVRVRAAAGRHATRRSRRPRRSSSRTTSRSAPTRRSIARRSARRASRPGTKIDNLVQVAHGVHVGRNVMLVGAGRHRRQHDHRRLRRARRAGRRGRAPAHRQGHEGHGADRASRTRCPTGRSSRAIPAIDNRDWLKSSAVFRRLPEMKKAAGRPRAPPGATSNRRLAPVPTPSARVARAITAPGWPHRNRHMTRVALRRPGPACRSLRPCCWRRRSPRRPASRAGQAVRPPSSSTPPRRCRTGCGVILHEDHSTPDRQRPGLVPRRVEGRAAGPDRLRAPVRAPDVQGLEERASPSSTRR